jgi:hypothetical protein
MELQLLYLEAEIAFSRGMIVASAGNEGGTSNPHIERQPMQYLYLQWRC